MKTWRFEFSAIKAKHGLMFASRTYFNRVISTLGDGEAVTVIVEKPQDTRSLAQNRALFGPVYDQLIDGLADEVGYDRHDKDGKDKLHEGLCIKYGGTVKDPITGLDVRKFRTSKATVSEFGAYLEWVARFAAQEHGVIVTLPGEM